MYKRTACLLILFNSVFFVHAQIVKIAHPVCESRVNPLGVALQGISFSWQLTTSQRNTFQKAYQLVIASTEQLLDKQHFDIYNSGIEQSNQSVLVIIKNIPLQPGTAYYWKVRVWDNHHQSSGWSSKQIFTTGLFAAADWAGAQWIGYENLPDALLLHPGVPDTSGLENKAVQRTIVPYFRKEFSTKRKPLKALAFITGLGQYELHVNGKKAGNRFLAPGWTYYDKTILYNVYDVTQLLSKGDNAIGCIVGNGFYNINRERYYKLNIAFGAPKMICKIKILYDDGTQSSVVSDASWTTTPSPTTYTSIYGGEDYNAQLEQSGWDKPGFNDTRWKHALSVSIPSGKLEPETDYPVEVMDSIRVVKTKQLNPHSYLYDFGQNAAGIIQLKIRGNKGDTVKIIPAELVDTTSHSNQNASGKPYYFTYILKGTGEEIWQPVFTYYGFRYVQVEGAAPHSAHNGKLPTITALTFLHTRNSAPATGSFTSSDTLFNKINTLIQWAIKSNMQSVVTDCPHREKLGWMEQNYLMGTSIQYNYNIHGLYNKLVDDMMDAQTAEGLIPDIAPEYVIFSGGFRDSPEWGSAAVIMPWLLYQWYGDTGPMQKAYGMMQRYVDYLERKSTHHILSYGLGDWYDYGPRFPGYAQLTPVALTATAIYYYDVVLLGRMAAIMGDTAEKKKLELLGADIKMAFNEKFFDPQKKVYAAGSQTAMAMPLVTGLVDEMYKKEVLQNLVDSIYAKGKALTAGDIGFHFLVKALDDGGASQLLYEMNHRNDAAGYGFQLKKGATALTESWAALAEVSNNHLMLGHIMEWFYSGLAGIGQEDSSVGYRHIKIRPQPVGNVTAAKASFQCPYGLIVSDWKKDGNGFSLHVVIPANTKATVYLPAGIQQKLYEKNKLVSSGLLMFKDNTVAVTISSGDYLFVLK